jgi:hypothetical protein
MRRERRRRGSAGPFSGRRPPISWRFPHCSCWGHVPEPSPSEVSWMSSWWVQRTGNGGRKRERSAMRPPGDCVPREFLPGRRRYPLPLLSLRHGRRERSPGRRDAARPPPSRPPMGGLRRPPRGRRSRPRKFPGSRPPRCVRRNGVLPEEETCPIREAGAQ